MSQLVTEGGVEGENDDNNSDNKTDSLDTASVKKFFLNGGVSESVYSKLVNIGLIEAHHFLFMQDNDINDLCNELNLNFGEKIKLKTTIRAFKQKYSKKNNNNVNIIRITNNEQNYIDKIENGIKLTDDLQHLFEKYFNQIDDKIINIKSNIDNKFESIYKSLKKQQKSLHKKVMLCYVIVYTYDIFIILSARIYIMYDMI